MGGSDPSDQEDAAEPVIDPLAERHPCYFHMHVFGEADYFMISSLKDKAKEQFARLLRISQRGIYLPR